MRIDLMTKMIVVKTMNDDNDDDNDDDDAWGCDGRPNDH